MTFDELDRRLSHRAKFGYVSGIASRPRNRLRSTFRSLGMLIGLAGARVPQRRRAAAQRGARGAAPARRRVGANAVIGLQFYVSEGGDGSCKVVAFGKAVAVRRRSAA